MSDSPRKTKKAAEAFGDSGLPNLDNFDYEATSTRQTETSAVAPASSRRASRAMLAVVAGADAGRVIPFDGKEVVIGRATNCELLLPDPGVSRRHARVVRRGSAVFLEDLRSKNGTFVDGAEVTRRELQPEDMFQVGPNVVIRLTMMTDIEAHLARQLYESSVRDPLTHVFNRRYFFERLRSELAYAERHKGEVSVIAIDFDHFKQLNDTFGHAAGDAALRDGAKRILLTLRSEDVLARVGGEEFAIVLRAITHGDALVCAERVRRAVELGSGSCPITISAGVATTDDLESEHFNAEALYEIADRRLYRAKSAGRNRVSGRT
jgi:two-component system, cell cycle response regulator